MTLSTHIAIAGALGKPLIVGGMGPVGLFLVGVGSHYLADAIPHYDYKLRYFVDEDEVAPPFSLPDFLLRDVGKVLLDIFVGSLLLFLVVGVPHTTAELLVWIPLVLGAITPDLLQGFRWLIPGKILDTIQRVQSFVHAEKAPFGAYALLSQGSILGFSLLLAYLL